MDEMKPRPAISCSPLTPLGFLERAATVYGDCPSIVYNHTTTYTWSQTHRRCLQLASSLVSFGIKPGQVVSVLAPNIPAMYELHFAVPMAGAILSTLNTRLDARTISVLLRHSESKLVFVDCLLRRLILDAVSLFSREEEIPTLILIPEEDDIDRAEENGYFHHDTYETMLAKGDPLFEWVRPSSEWDPMVLNYTSGTTSFPKGVVHCHRTRYIGTLDSLLDWSVPKQPVFLWTLPMFHSNGWGFTWGMAAVGGTNICLRKFDAKLIYALIERHRVTHMCGAPVVLNMLTNSPPPPPFSLQNNPVEFLTGGSPPPPTLLLKAESLGFNVTNIYGLTETGSMIVTCALKPQWNELPATERARLKARQGVRTAGMAEVDVVDPDSGVSVKRDGSSLGEIVSRGGWLMLGYLKDPVATSECMKDDRWFYTGDVGVIHPDGYLEIKDRSKDVIISGGENLSSVEVESVLYTNPAVQEAAVVARPDEFWGETPCAFLTLKAEYHQPPNEKEIIQFCRDRLPHFMVPKTVVFKDELPKTSTGKVHKFVLREMARSLVPQQ